MFFNQANLTLTAGQPPNVFEHRFRGRGTPRCCRISKPRRSNGYAKSIARLGCLIVVFSIVGLHAVGQDSESFEFDGIVRQQLKYSIVVKTRHGDISVQLTEKTSVSLRLTRPIIDFERRQLILELPISAVSGVADQNERVEFDLPSPLWLTARFDHETQRQTIMGSGIKRLARYDLHDGQTLTNSESSLDLEIHGELSHGNAPNQLQWIHDHHVDQVILGNRQARLLGFSILNLTPYETDVFVKGNLEDGQYFADEIEFAPVGDPLTREQQTLPRCLFLGDTISFNYQRPLREALSGVVNLHHPPVNCLGSSQWFDLHRWLGVYDLPDRRWDIITFNFGLWDDETEKAEYQATLRQVIEQLRQTNAKLIWVTSTPIDYGFNTDLPLGTLVPEADRETVSHEAANLIGKVPGRMRLQNDWAAEVLLDHPDIAVCDLWQVVANGRQSVYRDWWYNKDFTFEYPQSVPLARNLARYILNGLEQPLDRMNPMSAHTLEVEELSDDPADDSNSVRVGDATLNGLLDAGR